MASTCADSFRAKTIGDDDSDPLSLRFRRVFTRTVIGFGRQTPVDTLLRGPASGPVDALGLVGEGASGALPEQRFDLAALGGSFQAELVCAGVERYRVSREDAEDAYQAVLLTLLSTKPTVQCLAEYVRAAFFNRLIDVLRARASHRSTDIDHAPEARVSDSGGATLARETCRVLLASLDDRSRRLVTRHILDGVPLVELAGEVGYSPKTVGKKYRRAMARLKNAARSRQLGRCAD